MYQLQRTRMQLEQENSCLAEIIDLPEKLLQIHPAFMIDRGLLEQSDAKTRLPDPDAQVDILPEHVRKTVCTGENEANARSGPPKQST